MTRNRGPVDTESEYLEAGTLIRLHNRPGAWTVVRDAGRLIIIRRGKDYTSTPRENTRPAKQQTVRTGGGSGT